MEIDAFLILVLSVYAGDRFGWWTVALGAYRYLFVAASWALPWLNAALPPKFSRKVVAALQGVVLAVATAHLLPYSVTMAALAVALGTLTWSSAGTCTGSTGGPGAPGGPGCAGPDRARRPRQLIRLS